MAQAALSRPTERVGTRLARLASQEEREGERREERREKRGEKERREKERKGGENGERQRETCFEPEAFFPPLQQLQQQTSTMTGSDVREKEGCEAFTPGAAEYVAQVVHPESIHVTPKRLVRFVLTALVYTNAVNFVRKGENERVSYTLTL